eukprot:TRINITY_DN67797_c1_g4_i7.p1 TRINITY_DN67797_c1_g4~~TRINITY_DN67797_c1_g4_i7.p1  ORF type:complete len:117 (-),score=12.56 TRINITY_DN67797_c1_g4_i7:87-437(-)
MYRDIFQDAQIRWRKMGLSTVLPPQESHSPHQEHLQPRQRLISTRHSPKHMQPQPQPLFPGPSVPTRGTPVTCNLYTAHQITSKFHSLIQQMPPQPVIGASIIATPALCFTKEGER